MRLDSSSGAKLVSSDNEDGDGDGVGVKVKQEPLDEDIKALRAGQLRQSQDERVNSALKELYANSSPSKVRAHFTGAENFLYLTVFVGCFSVKTLLRARRWVATIQSGWSQH